MKHYNRDNSIPRQSLNANRRICRIAYDSHCPIKSYLCESNREVFLPRNCDTYYDSIRTCVNRAPSSHICVSPTEKYFFQEIATHIMIQFAPAIFHGLVIK
jgi:hypothetical protein